ncbi:MAG: GAP family protein [Chloroflexota bacterium]
MSPVLVNALIIAATGLIAPVSVTTVILLLMSDRGWKNGLWYMIGYIFSYSLIGIIVLVLEVGANRPPNPEARFIRALVLITLGVVLLIASLVNLYRQRNTPIGGPGRASRFANLVNDVTPLKSFGIAAFSSVANVKNFGTFLAATSVIGFSRGPLSSKMIMLIPVTFLFCLAVIIPVVIYWAFPERATVYLGQIRDGISRYGQQVVLGLLLTFSALFLFNGITGLMRYLANHPL